MRIAVLMTCHNRCSKTLACLEHLFGARSRYNELLGREALLLHLFVTDDGCTDGTATAIVEHFGHEQVHIVVGDGTLYWAGGMRRAWQAAIDMQQFDAEIVWDYYLLLNDDTLLNDDCFAQLLEAQQKARTERGTEGLASGITCDPSQPSEITYGGAIYRQGMLMPTGAPQYCDRTNANILLVAADVVRRIGILYDGFVHHAADFDYSAQAASHGVPVLVTGRVCGICANVSDHGTLKSEHLRLSTMTLAQRRAYYHDPVHSYSDYLLYIKRNDPLRYPLVLIGQWLSLYWPSLYCRLKR